MAARSRRIPDPKTANELWFDAMIRHQIQLLRFQAGLGRRVRQLLDATESDLRRSIRDRVRRLPRGTQTSASIQRLDRLLKEVREIRTAAHREVGALLTTELNALAVAEPKFLQAIFQTVVPVQVSTTLPDARRLRAIVRFQPFEGTPVEGWVEGMKAADIRRIEGQIRIGLTQGESVPEITRRVVGTKSKGGANGVVGITRRDAEAIVRTTANGVANTSAEEFFKENEEFFDDVLFVATLDGNTTPVCRANDGKRFRIKEGPMPPLHVRCRSRRISVLDPEALGRRPSNPTNRRRMLREFAKEEGLDKVPRSRKKLPRGTKGKFDQFERRRVRELTGTVPASTTYEQWLRKQPVAFQRDVLGNAKADLFRRGKLPLDRFIDERGIERTLADIARTDGQAFIDAGLDPDRFLK